MYFLFADAADRRRRRRLIKTGGADYRRRVAWDTSVTDVERQLNVADIISTECGSTLAQDGAEERIVVVFFPRKSDTRVSKQ